MCHIQSDIPWINQQSSYIDIFLCNLLPLLIKELWNFTLPNPFTPLYKVFSNAEKYKLARKVQMYQIDVKVSFLWGYETGLELV